MLRRSGKEKPLFDLTRFPTPGVQRFGSKELCSNTEQSERQKIVHSNCTDDIPSTVSNRCQARDYWMPDRLCKKCYECELQFNMFRRKHHCRLCGQVFCHSCSSYFVDGKVLFVSGKIRTCKLCHGQILTVTAPSVYTANAKSGSNSSHSSLSATSLAYHRSLGSRYEEPGNCVAYDVHSLTTLHSMDLQQHFAEDVASTADRVHSDVGKSRLNLANKSSPTFSTQERLVTSIDAVSRQGAVLKSRLSNDPHAAEHWRKSAFNETIEASLRRRLLGSSSIPVPASAFSGTVAIEEAAADIVHARYDLSSRAAQHLSAIVVSLVRADVIERCGSDVGHPEAWSAIIIDLLQKAIKAVSPAISLGDQMDIRPYIKVKSIPGGSSQECSYIDGVVFRKHVVHKRMARACKKPRILLMSGALEFQRSCTRLASFGTLVEQEQRHTQIMIEKIVSLRPDVLLVGQSVSRQAQEYLLQHQIVVIQNIKPTLLQRIARATQAAIMSSTDHVNNMGQIGCTSLGYCQRLQIISYLDPSSSQVNSGNLQIRRHGTNYVHLAGCPEALGCTLVLRGAKRPMLKVIKHIVRFGLYVAYHLRLETAYLLDCGSMLPAIKSEHSRIASELLATSLAVRFGEAFYRPGTQLPLTAAHDYQGLLVTSVWMSQHVQCALAEVKAFFFYTPQDLSLGQFLLESCFSLDLKHPHGDRRSVLDITQIFYHNTGSLAVTVVKLDQALSPKGQEHADRPILMWSYCHKCERVVTPLVPMSNDTWKLSFGKFLEISFYNKSACSRNTDCRHCIQPEHIHFFGWGNLAARIEHAEISLYDIPARKYLPFDLPVRIKQLNCCTTEMYHQCLQQFKRQVLRLKSMVELISRLEASQSSETSSELLGCVICEVQRVSDEIDLRTSELHKIREAAINSDPSTMTRYAFYRKFILSSSNWNDRVSLLGRLATGLADSYKGSPVDPINAAARRDLVALGIRRLRMTKHGQVEQSGIHNVAFETTVIGQQDPWKVPLTGLRDRVSLDTGVQMHEDQPTTIIAYSLNSSEYKHALQAYLCKSGMICSAALHGSFRCGIPCSKFETNDTSFRWGAGLTSLMPSGDGANFLETKNSFESTGVLEEQLLSPQQTHVNNRFADVDEGRTLRKFACQAYWAVQFAAVRRAYIGFGLDEELGYLRSLSMANPWNAQGGKSGATFLKTLDGRFVVKQITRTELQMFLEYAPAYFEYLSKSFFHKYETVLVKVLGVYQIGSHNRVSGRRNMEQVVVMENLFHNCSITRAFDLKGSTRSRYARVGGCVHKDASLDSDRGQISSEGHPVLLDENFVEFTNGRPLALYDHAKAHFNSAVLNDTLFLSLINVVDYSILVGMDENRHELVVGIIDYMRQYDVIKKMERMGKSVGMIAGQAEPTVIQPPNYRNRFQAAMERYFMMVPDKWTLFRMQAPTGA